MPPLPAPQVLPENIDKIINLAHVIVFTTDNCVACMETKQFFDEQNVQHMEICIHLGDHTHRELQSKFNATSLPQIFVGCRHVGGYDDLIALDNVGQLTELLHS